MRTITVLTAGFILFSGCSTVYVPNMVNMPLLREQGQVNASFSVAQDLQFAYAPTPHLGLMVNGFYKKETNILNDGPEASNGWGHLIEFGAGYYNPFHDLLSAEGFGGIGLGSVTSQNIDTSGNERTWTARGLKMFIQPNLGLSSRFIDAGVAGRFAMVKFSNIRTRNYTQDQLEAEGLAGLDRPAFFFFEPALTVRFGYQWFKVFAQWGTSLKLNPDPLNFRDNYLLLGVHMTLAPRYLTPD